MAITFEKRNNASKILFVLLLAVILLAAGGYFAWMMFSESKTPVATETTNAVTIKKNLFSDARINNLDLFPQIPALTIDLSGVQGGRSNPFKENTETIIKDEDEAVNPDASDTGIGFSGKKLN